MELRDRPLAQHRRGRAVRPAGMHRRYAGDRRARARQVQGAAHHAASRRRSDAGVRAPPAELPVAAPVAADHGAARQPAAARVGRRRESLARPRVVHRGDAGLLLRARGGGGRARAPRAAQDADAAVRAIGAWQDLDSRRGHRAEAARARVLPGVPARRLCARRAIAFGAIEERDLPRDRAVGAVDAGGRRRRR